MSVHLFAKQKLVHSYYINWYNNHNGIFMYISCLFHTTCTSILILRHLETSISKKNRQYIIMHLFTFGTRSLRFVKNEIYFYLRFRLKE